MDTITLFAPLSGRIMPIAAIPDPVYARKMAGEGLALDPTSTAVLAPCDGEITHLHPGQHEVTIACQNVEILIHIGLNTAPLLGEGFLAHVRPGEQVHAGQKLIEFDPDYVAAHADSLLSVVQVRNPERVDQFYKSAGDVQAGQDVLMELTLVDPSSLAAAGIYKPIVSEPITLPNPNGLHLRPAAVLASLCRSFQSEIMLRRESEEANAKSLTAILSLSIDYQDELRLAAAGPDAYEAISILTPAIINGLGEEGGTPIQAPASIIQPAIAAPFPREESLDPNLLRGVPITPGLAIGTIYQLRPTMPEMVETAADPRQERQRLDHALAAVRLHLEALRSRTQAGSNPGQAALLAAQHELLDDPDLLDRAYAAVDRGNSAEFAWIAAINDAAAHLEGLQRQLLAARARDLREAGRRVANQISGIDPHNLPLPQGVIIVAEDVSPDTVTALRAARSAGLATVLGGPISEAANQARALSLPTIGAVEARVLSIPNGTSVILDGARGTLRLNPSAEEIATVRRLILEQEQEHTRDLGTAFESAYTVDGLAIQVQAPAAGIDEAQEALQMGSDGICWLSTEHLFLSRRTAPSEDRQTIFYSEVANALPPDMPVSVRTLAISSRRPLPYLPLAAEPNPTLGLRGARFTLDQPQLLRKQCRAILRAAAETARPLQILLPMIATPAEWQLACHAIAAEREKMALDAVPIGLILQVPAAALAAGALARDAAFFILDADDMAQHALAMDAGHPYLAGRIDALEPAVLRLIQSAVEGARSHGKPLSVCGVAAADPQAIPILVGLGVAGLIVHPKAIPGVKAQIRGLSMEHVRDHALQALAQETAAQVRALQAS